MNPELQFHSFQSGILWASGGSHILSSGDYGGNFTRYARVPAGPLIQLFPLLRRFLRNGIHHILPISDRRVMVVLKGRFIFLEDGKICNTHVVDRGSRPLRSGICLLPGGTLIYGDYWSNPGREPVRLHISTDEGKNWEILWQSEAGQARHIHLVQPVSGSPAAIYFSTGDLDQEVALFRLNTQDGRVAKIGGDSQAWRMVSLIQLDDVLYWGSDCEYEQNHIYRFDLNNRELQQLQEIPGPAYYSTRDSKGFFYIATTVEDSKRHRAAILVSKNGFRWETIRTFKKDPWPPKLFGYGIIEFIHGQEKMETLLYNIKGLL